MPDHTNAYSLVNHKIMKPLLLLLLSLWMGRLSAQVSITGRITTADGRPVPFANVLLLDGRDSSLVKGAITNESGHYEMDRVGKGTYFLKYCALGYRALTSPGLDLTGPQGGKDMGNTVLQAEVRELKNVTVDGEKPMYYHESDRMVINVGSSLFSKGHSALEMLERSPGVYIDRQTGAILLNGKSGATIAVNGKPIPMQQTQVIAFLNSIDANSIDRIELISTPSAKYDAQGSAGIINFVWKRDTELGTKGSFTLTGGYGYGEKASAGIEMAHTTEKISAYASYSFDHDRNLTHWIADGFQVAPSLGGAMNFDFRNTQKNVPNSHNAVAGIDVQLNRTTIGGSILFNSSSTSVNISNYARYTYPDSVLQMNSKINEANRWSNTMGGLYMERRLREGEKMRIDISGLYYKNDNPTQVQNAFLDGDGKPVSSDDALLSPFHAASQSETIRSVVAKMDYAKQLCKTVRLETGVKASYNKSSSNGSITSEAGSGSVSPAEDQTDLRMTERIGAAYASADLQFGPATTLVIGARYEYSLTHEDDALAGKRIVDRSLGKVLPSFVFSRAINEKSSWQLSYDERLTRPSYLQLLTSISYNDPVSVGTGNPLLRTAVTNNLKAAYNYRGSSFSVLLSRDDYPIVDFQVVTNASGDLLYITSQNLRYQNSLILQADIPLKLTDWWSTRQGFSGGWRQYEETYTDKELKHSYFGYSVYSTQSFKLPADFGVELSGRYFSTSYVGTVRTNANKSVDLAIRKQLRNNRGSIQFTVTDLFRSLDYGLNYGTLTKEAYSLKSMLIFYPEAERYGTYKLTYSRSFGNTHVKRRKQDIGSQQEWSRIRG
jgi:iron complex outermembrane recepter protein